AGRLGRWAAEVTAPSVIPWQTVIGGYLRRAVRRKPKGAFKTFSRASRRQAIRVRMPDGSRGRKIILPGTFRPDPTIVVIRDTSGSMSDTELGEVGREITEIAQRCGVHEDRVFVLDVDAAVYRARALSETGVLHSAFGGGGTDMRLGLAAVPELFDKDPELVIVATDGGTDWPETAPSFPVVALITSDGSDTSPDWMPCVPVTGGPAGAGRDAGAAGAAMPSVPVTGVPAWLLRCAVELPGGAPQPSRATSRARRAGGGGSHARG